MSMQEQKRKFEVEVMEPEMITVADKTKGINQPGLTQGVTYVDCNGNTRYKYETLEVLSNRGITDGVISDEKKDENTQESVEPIKETPTPEVPEDLVPVIAEEVVEEVVEDKPEPIKKKPTPKPVSKPVAKTTATKTVAKPAAKKTVTK